MEHYAVQLEISHEDETITLVCPWCWEMSRISAGWVRDHGDERMPCPKCAMTSGVPVVAAVVA